MLGGNAYGISSSLNIVGVIGSRGWYGGKIIWKHGRGTCTPRLLAGKLKENRKFLRSKSMWNDNNIKKDFGKYSSNLLYSRQGAYVHDY